MNEVHIDESAERRLPAPTFEQLDTAHTTLVYELLHNAFPAQPRSFGGNGCVSVHEELVEDELSTPANPRAQQYGVWLAEDLWGMIFLIPHETGSSANLELWFPDDHWEATVTVSTLRTFVEYVSQSTRFTRIRRLCVPTCSTDERYHRALSRAEFTMDHEGSTEDQPLYTRCL